MGARRFLPAVITLALVLALVAGGGVVGGGQALGAVTTITVLSADVSVRHGTGGTFAAAIDGEVLRGGDAVRTGASGRAILTYFEGSSVTIEPSTELAIDRADGAPDGTTIVLMTQQLGRTWHVVSKLVTGGSKYEVRTPASTASVRGTEFEVHVDDRATTVTTTGGTVVDEVPDPAQQGRIVEVPVVAGTTHVQPRDAAPTAPKRAEEPKRTVTVTVEASNSLVVDAKGRANGLTTSGRLVAQTPGARVTRDDASIVVTLPDPEDGKLATRVEKNGDDGRVRVRTKIEDREGRSVELEDEVERDRDRSATSAVQIGSGTAGRVLHDDEKASLPSPRVAERTPAPTPRRTGTPASTIRATDGGRPTATARPTRTPEPTWTRTASPSPRERETETPRPSGTRRP